MINKTLFSSFTMLICNKKKGKVIYYYIAYYTYVQDVQEIRAISLINVSQR